jgi:class 3 adenylate cyclase
VEQATPEAGHRTFIATVVFIDIVGYSERLVTQQVELKTRLNGLVADVLQNVAASDRMMLDTGDGAAICFLGDPEDALFAASNLRASTVAIGPELAPPDRHQPRDRSGSSRTSTASPTCSATESTSPSG